MSLHLFRSRLHKHSFSLGLNFIFGKNGMPASLIILLLLLGIMLVAWSFAVPIDEAPDEQSHWEYILYLYKNGQLPIYSPYFVEANQPPLYYFMVAPFSGDSEVPRQLERTDSQRAVYTSSKIKFYQILSTDWEVYWPIRRIRLLTALLAVLSVGWLLDWFRGHKKAFNGFVGCRINSISAAIHISRDECQ
jgi:hypothetical protein